MADLAYRALDNIRMHMAAITPSETATSAPGRFREWTDTDNLPGDSSGSSRSYQLVWMGSGEDEGLSDGYSRLATHRIRLDVYYSSRHPADALMRIVMRDRSDIIKRLNVPTVNGTLVGYAGATSTPIGLYNRVRDEDELIRVGDIYILRMIWRCQIDETES